jgi:hypothetical protein
MARQQSWTAVVLYRFWTRHNLRKRQRAGAVQDLAETQRPLKIRTLASCLPFLGSDSPYVVSYGSPNGEVGEPICRGVVPWSQEELAHPRRH